MVCIESMTTRSGFGDLRHDVLQQRLGVDHALLVADPEPHGAHLDLLGRLLARDVEGLQSVRGQGDLERKGRFADARLAAQQHERSGDHAAAQHAVHLGVAQIEPPVFALADVTHPLGFRRRQRPCGDGRYGAALARHDLFREGVPFPARGTFPQPFGGFESAVFAEEGFFYLCHPVQYAFAEVYSLRTARVMPAAG